MPTRDSRMTGLAVASELLQRIIEEATAPELLVIAAILDLHEQRVEEREAELDDPPDEPSGWGHPARLP